jgi:hypothetical protein
MCLIPYLLICHTHPPGMLFHDILPVVEFRTHSKGQSVPDGISQSQPECCLLLSFYRRAAYAMPSIVLKERENLGSHAFYCALRCIAAMRTDQTTYDFCAPWSHHDMAKGSALNGSLHDPSPSTIQRRLLLKGIAVKKMPSPKVKAKISLQSLLSC